MAVVLLLLQPGFTDSSARQNYRAAWRSSDKPPFAQLFCLQSLGEYCFPVARFSGLADLVAAIQARILLEEAGMALAEAEGPGGMGPLSGTEAGVYVGCMYQEYTDVLAAAGGKLSAATATGNSLSFLVGRVSYTFALQASPPPQYQTRCIHCSAGPCGFEEHQKSKLACDVCRVGPQDHFETGMLSPLTAKPTFG